MIRAAPFSVAVCALAMFSGVTSAASGLTIVESIATALPVPDQRDELPRYAVWVLTIVGLGYLGYLRARRLRRGGIRQLLLRFGTPGRLLVREYRGALGRLALTAVGVVAFSAAGAVLGGAREWGDATTVAPGALAWLLEGLCSALVLLAVGLVLPWCVSGLLATALFIPLGALPLTTEADLLLFGALSLATGLVTVAAMTSKDWTGT